MSDTKKAGSDNDHKASTSSSDSNQNRQAMVANPIYDANSRHFPENEEGTAAVAVASASSVLQGDSERYIPATSALEQLVALQAAANSHSASTGNLNAGRFPNFVPSQSQNNASVAGIQNPFQLIGPSMVHPWYSPPQHALPTNFLAPTLANSPQIHIGALAGLFGTPMPSTTNTVPPWLAAMGASAMWGGGPQGLNMSNPPQNFFHPQTGPSLSLTSLQSTVRSAQVSNPPPASSSSLSTSIMPTNRPPIVLYTDLDEHVLNEYQCLLRKQIELFENGVDDVKGKAQGRNNPIVVGQVGIRCRHCAGLPKSTRSKGAVYYSRSLPGMYQVAQVMAKIHFGRDGCRRVPSDVRERLLELKVARTKPSGGKEYWVHCLTVAGVYEDGQTLRFKPLDQLPQQPQLQRPL